METILVIIAIVATIAVIVVVVHLFFGEDKETRQKIQQLEAERESKKNFLVGELELKLEEILENTGVFLHPTTIVGSKFIFKYAPEGYPLSNLTLIGQINGVSLKGDILEFHVSGQSFKSVIVFSKHHGWLLVNDSEDLSTSSLFLPNIVKNGYKFEGTNYGHHIRKGDFELIWNLYR